jgi:DNA-binding NtrC family response regulator
VLVTGESGTGKELIAAALHHSSPRAGGPFVRLNCTALPQGMLESELFGHVKGAFTDAHRDRAGRFESARGGTLFLDEIGDISEQMQVKLLRVLESGEFERVGDSVTLKTDARIISATNRDLERRVEEGKFRRDLYYRLNVIQIHLPPLRERQEDIPLLVEHFLAEVEQDGGGTPTLSPDAMDLMMRYPWPGNVRELRNCIEHALIVCRGAVILPRHLPQRIRQAGAAAEASPGLGADASLARLQRLGEGELELGSGLDEQEQRARVVRALDATLWNVSRAAELLGVSRNTVYRKIRQWELKRPDEDSTEPGE